MISFDRLVVSVMMGQVGRKGESINIKVIIPSRWGHLKIY